MLSMEEIVRRLNLYFSGNELIEVEFIFPTGESRRSVRGKQSGASFAAGTFQWTSAVRGLSLLAVRTAAQIEMGMISGENGSITASLDYAISKQPMWLIDMFGVDRFGTSLIRRMISRTNPERKRPGPTILAINPNYLSADGINIFVDGVRCGREALVVLAVVLACEPSVAVVEPEIAKAA